MPCMYNGKPVKGVKGACPTNSTWVEEPSTPSKSSGSFFDRYVTDDGNINYGKAALEATYLTPLGLGRGLLMRGGKYALDKVFRKNLTGKALENQIKKNQLNVTAANTNKFGLANPTTRNIPGQPARKSSMIDPITGKPINLPPVPASTVTTPARNVLAPFNAQAGQRGIKQLMDNMGSTRKFAPLRTAGIGAAGLAGYDQFGPGLTQASKEIKANQAASAQAIQNKAIEDNTQALAQRNATEAATKAEADRVASLNPMERIMENLKKPGFLTDPLIPGGPPSYNRLSKLGVLMDYYGSTPKQRATKTEPNKQFAAIEKGVMDNATALAKAQATLKSQYGKPTVSNLAEGMFDLVKDAYGGTWLPFDDKSDDELKRISSLAAIRLTELAQDPNYMNLGEEQLRGEAVRQVGEELGL